MSTTLCTSVGIIKQSRRIIKMKDINKKETNCVTAYPELEKFSR